MKLKILRYAAGRDDRIVSAYEEVTFANEHAGYYLAAKHEYGNSDWDEMHLVERIGKVCFFYGAVSRMQLCFELFDRIAKEAHHLQAAMQQRMKENRWIPLPYIAVYEAFGWDTRPLITYRTEFRQRQEAKDKERRRQQEEREALKRREREHREQMLLEDATRRFMVGEMIEAEHFIGLCHREHIVIHPRTCRQLRTRILEISKTQARYRKDFKGQAAPQLEGYFKLAERLSDVLEKQGDYCRNEICICNQI